METVLIALAGAVVGGAVLFGVIVLYGKSQKTVGKAETKARFSERVAQEEKVRAQRAQEVVSTARMSARERLHLMRRLAGIRADEKRRSQAK